MSDAELQYGYTFPAIRGVQAGREYFVSMCPLRIIPKIFLFDDDELVPELRAQRILNRSRVPEMTRYILDNPQDYVFSALTASIDGEVQFSPVGSKNESRNIGSLHVPLSARFIINDGQHRRAAIELALKENPDLANESISVVFFLDIGLERCQQMFADLNRHAIRPARSLGVLYDHRDERAQLTKLIVLRSTTFRDVVEMERSTLSQRSRKLFTLSALYTATSILVSHRAKDPLESKAAAAAEYWEEVAKQFPEWKQVRDRVITAGDVRRDFIHSHGIVLQALGHVGNTLMGDGAAWRRELKKLKAIDWSRSNAKLWEGRAMTGGRVVKNRQNVVLTANAIKKKLGLELAPEEQRLEDAFRRGDHV